MHIIYIYICICICRMGGPCLYSRSLLPTIEAKETWYRGKRDTYAGWEDNVVRLRQECAARD
jgi:hypothetical protein